MRSAELDSESTQAITIYESLSFSQVGGGEWGVGSWRSWLQLRLLFETAAPFQRIYLPLPTPHPPLPAPVYHVPTRRKLAGLETTSASRGVTSSESCSTVTCSSSTGFSRRCRSPLHVAR